MHFTAHPAEHCAWQLKRLGKARYEALMVRANTYRKKDRKLALIVAKKLLEDLEESRRKLST